MTAVKEKATPSLKEMIASLESDIHRTENTVRKILNSKELNLEEAVDIIKEHQEKLELVKEIPYTMLIRDAQMYKALSAILPHLQELL